MARRFTFSKARHKLRDMFGRYSVANEATEESLSEDVQEAVADIYSDGLGDLWDDITDESLTDAELAREFTVENDGAELFRLGWMEFGGDADETQAARDQFFDLMEAYDISRDEFDWDAWRDWYTGES